MALPPFRSLRDLPPRPTTGREDRVYFISSSSLAIGTKAKATELSATP